MDATLIFNALVDFFASPPFFAVSLALLGGAVRVLYKSQGGVRVVLARLAASGFSGLLVYLFLRGHQIDESTKIAMSGLAGYLGIEFLDAVSHRVLDPLFGGKGKE